MSKLLLAIDEEFTRAWGPNFRVALEEICEVRVVDPALLRDPDIWAREIIDVDVAVVSWSFPEVSEERLSKAPHLRLVINAGSSVRFLFPRGIPQPLRVSQAGQAMVPAVAEASLLFTMMLLRAIPARSSGLARGGDWKTLRSIGNSRELSGATIGVVGASRTGRHYISLCERLGVAPLVFDPYVSPADPLFARCRPLEEILRCSDVVALHAPLTEETRGMIGRRELALMRNGAGLVNTARAALVDLDALFDELLQGRLTAALDVFDEEPLPVDSCWRTAPNLIATPHIAGKTNESRRRAGEIVLDEARRYLRGAELLHELSPDRFDIVG